MLRHSSILLGLALSVALAATAKIGLQESAAESVPLADAAQVLPPASGAQPSAAAIGRTQFDALEENPFDAKTWYVPPPPPPVVVAQPQEPPKPTAPPLPFGYVGQMEEESGRTVIYLAQGNRVLTVGAGAHIDGHYRVDSIGDAAIQFTYLPLDIKQTLSIARNAP
jgi:hypothetical protein